MTNFKRSILFSLAAAVAVAVAPGRGQAVCTGDPAAPAGISGADTTNVLQCITNPANATCAAACGGAGILNCADVNLDGALTISDAVIIANEANTISGGCPLNVVPLCTSPGAVLACGSTISADITTNTQLSNCEYSLDGTVFVQPGAVVTIRPGATIKGKSVTTDGTPSALIFLQGDCAALGGDNAPGAGTDNQPDAGDPFTARINAAGTQSNPIVFTSDQAVGLRNSGDWAGVAFQGCSHVNEPDGTGTAEGLVGVEFGGGTDNILDESSGVATYVRAEYAGRELSPNNELNVWTMNSVGSCTTFDFIQAHAGTDDGFEWFGGTVNMKHIVATANRDDNFDWQLGTTGKVQYGVVQQTGTNIDTAGSNGLEGDNSETAPDDDTVLPRSQPRFCNITAIGEQNPPGGTNFGILARRGTAGNVAKAIIHCFDDGGLQLRNILTGRNACSDSPFTLLSDTSTPFLIEASIFGDNDQSGTGTAADCGVNATGGNVTAPQCASTDFCGLIYSVAAFPAGLGSATRADATNAAISIPCTYGQLDPSPSIAAEASNTFDCETGIGTGDGFFESNNYLGAIDPNGSTWLTSPWINFALN